MDIAIIGAGNVGRSLASAFVSAGHQVTIASRDLEDAEAVGVGDRRLVSTSNEAAARTRRP